MTSVSTLETRSSADMYLSDESARFVASVRRLLEVGRERGASTSLTEAKFMPLSEAATRRFNSLAETWRKECAHLSSIREMVLHPAYQQIVGMGPAALPLIFAELEREPNHWFWALRAITGEDPVLPEHRGNVRLMAEDWLHWGRTRGFIG